MTEGLCRFLRPEYRRDIYTYDPAGVVRHKPNYSAQVFSDRSEMGWMQVDTDHNGLRISKQGKPIGTEKKLKILLLGDSLSYGQHLDYRYSYPELLAQKLSLMVKKPVEVLNCSVVAANLIELYNAYNSYCHFKEIDLVVVQPTIYDGPSPFALFYGEALGKDFQLLAFLHQCYPGYDLKSSLKQDEFGLLKLDANQVSKRKIYTKYFGAWTPLYEWLHFARKIEHNFVTKFKFSCRNLKFPLLYTSEAIDVFKSIEERYKLPAINLPSSIYALTILKKWSQKVLKKNGKFLVIGLPNARGLNIDKTRIDKPDRQFTNHIYKKREPRQLEIHYLMYNDFLDKLKKNNIAFIDFLDTLSKFETNEIFLHEDIHFNELGHRVIATKLASFVMDKNMLK